MRLVVLVLLFGGDVQGLALSRSPRVARRCGAPLLQQEPAGRASDAVRSELATPLDLEGKVVPLGQGKVVPPEDCMYTACPVPAEEAMSMSTEEATFSYVAFARDQPFANNIAIATVRALTLALGPSLALFLALALTLSPTLNLFNNKVKTAAADLLAQTVIAQTPLDAVDWQRSLLFCLFGATYLGGFQYLYQVQIFKRVFDVDAFTSQPLCGKQGGSDLGQLALRRPLPGTDRASGYPELRPASANQPLGPRWPAI